MAAFSVLKSSDHGLLSIAIKLTATLAIAGFLMFFYKLCQVRMMVRRAIKSPGVFALPHSFWFGHLPTIVKLAIKYKFPADGHGQLMPLLIAKEYPEALDAGCLYMDVWPVGPATIAVFHPDMMAQFTQEQNQPKHPNMLSQFLPLTGAKDLVCSEGKDWKTARAIFNPGFSARNILSLVPNFIEEVLVFRDYLRECAKKDEIIRLEDATTNLSVDIIGRAVLGARVHAQKRPVEFMKAMLGQIKLLYFDLNLKKMLNPLRPLRHYALNRTFFNEMMPYIQHTVQNYEKIEGPKTVLNLALKSYVEEVQDVSTRGSIPADFLAQVVVQIKIFLFAGHDTTAITLTYAYEELYNNPSKLAALRAEHDSVLGTDVSEAANRLAAEPGLLNQMPYTLAVVKETLRLFPPAGTVRIGSRGFVLRNPETGVQYQAEGFMLYGCSSAGHRNPRVWPEPDSFIPERWLARNESDPLHPVKNAFRPWEQGSRNCIGQELASLELRLILALTVREFDMVISYPDHAETMNGLKHYQTQPPEVITAHPKGGMPVKVKIRA